MCFGFFFQAEDGIRVYKVTGVQTCALPIWRRRDGRLLRILLLRGEVDADGHVAAGERRYQHQRQEPREIGRASCRERGETSMGAVSLKTKRTMRGDWGTR